MNQLQVQDPYSVTIQRYIPEIFEVFDKPTRFKVAEGGRGGGKSHYFAEELVEQVFLYGKLVLCCREIQKSLKDSVKALIENKIDKLGLRRFFKSTKGEITCPHNGGRIAFAGLRDQGSASSAAENLKSFEGADICWVEEAQTVSKFSLEILLPTIRKKGSEIWFSYNRKADNEPVHSKFVEAEFVPEGTAHVYVNYFDNPWFAESPLYDLMMADKMNSLEDYKHIWLGLPKKRTEATILTNWTVREFLEDPEAMIAQGADFGFSPDPATITRGWVDFDKMRIYISYAEFGLELTARQLPQLYDSIPNVKNIKIQADSARNDLIQSMKDEGYRIEGAPKPPGSIEMGLDWLKCFEIWIHPRCCEHPKERPDLCLEFELNNYSRKTDPKTEEVLPIIIDKNNHAIDSIRYMFNKHILREGSIDYVKMMMSNHSKSKVQFDRQKLISHSQGNKEIGAEELMKELEENAVSAGVSSIARPTDPNIRKVYQPTSGVKLPGGFSF